MSTDVMAKKGYAGVSLYAELHARVKEIAAAERRPFIRQMEIMLNDWIAGWEKRRASPPHANDRTPAEIAEGNAASDAMERSVHRMYAEREARGE